VRSLHAPTSGWTTEPSIEYEELRMPMRMVGAPRFFRKNGRMKLLSE
jgi:hypothetical protein